MMNKFTHAVSLTDMGEFEYHISILAILAVKLMLYSI